MQIRDPVMNDFDRAMLRGETSISIDPSERLLAHTVLGQPFREMFIKKVQMPLEKCLLLVTKLIPEITMRNTNFEGTHAIMSVFDKLREYTDVKPGLIKAASKIIIYKIEVDRFYRDLFILFIEEVIKKILAGKFPPREEGKPITSFWNTCTPHGGKKSIIAILQDKKALENLMGDDWKLK